MSLRIKLVISYVVMLVISVILIVAFGVGMVMGAMRYSAESFLGDQTVGEAAHSVVEIVVDLRYTEKYFPETLVQDSFPTQIAERISVFNGFLVVENDGQFKTYGAKNTDRSLYSLIGDAADIRSDCRQRHDHYFKDDTIIWNKEEYAVFKYSFQPYSEEISYYFLIKTENAEVAAGHNYRMLIAGLIFLTVIVIGPLLWIITKDIIVPLKKLENCASQISIGNLDFHLQSKSRNEIGSVIRSYEKMRLELKKSIDKQLEMEENRKQLLSSITHDLKTPITSIKGYVQGIRDGVANDEEKMSKYLDVIYSKSVDMDAMIDDLFLFSKLDLGKEPFNMDYEEIKDFYLSCVKELQLELDSTGVVLVTECLTTEGLKVLMDSQKIKRVILNIVSNSLKFMDKENKQLNMVFVEQNGFITIKIRDNGIGIEQQDLEKVFDRFYRTDPSRNRNTGGSGLGLAIAKQIIERHKGTIEAQSKKGEWTEISFHIPL